jgi:hypothetical protein
VISELDLDRAFANRLTASLEFCSWLLNRTKFADSSHQVILLDKEQMACKPRKKPENWWRHWWCKLEDGTESETDIFVVFGFKDSTKRIALHIEDKPPHGKFTPEQWLNYHRRAEFMRNTGKFMNYSEFTTVLLAPRHFIEVNHDRAGHFECQISYEELATEIPLFGTSLEEHSRRQRRREGN